MKSILMIISLVLILIIDPKDSFIQKNSDAELYLDFINFNIGSNQQDRCLNDSFLTLKDHNSPNYFAKKMNGIGVIRMTTMDKGLSLYATYEILNHDNSTYASWNYQRKELIIEGERHELFKITDSHLKLKYGFEPRIFNTEYEIIQFDVINKNEEYFEIVINSEGETKKIKADLKFLFTTWEEYIGLPYIQFDPVTNPLREYSSELSEFISLKKSYIYKAVEINGDWIKIECDDTCMTCDIPNLKGWIKWREDDMFLVKIGFLC